MVSVEDDAPCYALGASQRTGNFVMEGRPSPKPKQYQPVSPKSKPQRPGMLPEARRSRCAVLSTGIDGTHPDLAPNYKGGISFVPRDQPHGF